MDPSFRRGRQPILTDEAGDLMAVAAPGKDEGGPNYYGKRQVQLHVSESTDSRHSFTGPGQVADIVQQTSLQLLEDLTRVTPQRRDNIVELNYVQPSLAAFIFGDEGLWPLQP